MTAGTHFALPIVVAGSLSLRRAIRTGEPLLSRWHILLVGISGLLPDIMTPHISLQSRYTSWSHTLWFFLGFLVLCLAVAKWLPSDHRAAAHCCWFAVLLHLLCDMISGGIDLVQPFGSPVGDYYFPVRYWLHLDLATVLGAYLICWYTRHHLKRQNWMRRRHANQQVHRTQ